MNRYEAREYVDRVQSLSNARANPGHVLPAAVPFLHELDIEKEAGDALTEDEVLRVSVALAEIEEAAAATLQTLPLDESLRIIRNDGAGPSSDPKRVAFNTLAEVDHIEVLHKEKILELRGGELRKLPATEYIAHGVPYEVNGRTTHDYTRSGPEGYIGVNDEWKPFGAASALLARLLEARAEGTV